MRERERAGLAVALVCLLVIVFRTLSPAFHAGYDWIALVLTLLASMGLMLPVLYTPRPTRAASYEKRQQDLPPSVPHAEQSAPDAPDQQPSLAWEALQLRVDALAWHRPEGGLYDGLCRLSATNLYAAVCGAYATLLLLLEQSSESQCAREAPDALLGRHLLSTAEADALRALLDMLEAFSQIGARQADEHSAQALLGMTLCATGRVEVLLS